MLHAGVLLGVVGLGPRRGRGWGPADGLGKPSADELRLPPIRMARCNGTWLFSTCPFTDLIRPMPTDSRATDLASSDFAKERTTVLATYPTRRDAEMAKDRLESAGYGAFITADDAGGMHVEMQLTNGVKLIGLEGEAEDARALLEDAEMLPVPVDVPSPDDSDASGLGGTALLAFGLGLTTLGLYLWLGTTADPFAIYLLAGPGLAMALTGWIRRRRAASSTESDSD